MKWKLVLLWVIFGLCRGNIGIMENKMETTILDYVGFYRVLVVEGLRGLGG